MFKEGSGNVTSLSQNNANSINPYEDLQSYFSNITASVALATAPLIDHYLQKVTDRLCLAVVSAYESGNFQQLSLQNITEAANNFLQNYLSKSYSQLARLRQKRQFIPEIDVKNTIISWAEGDASVTITLEELFKRNYIAGYNDQPPVGNDERADQVYQLARVINNLKSSLNYSPEEEKSIDAYAQEAYTKLSTTNETISPGLEDYKEFLARKMTNEAVNSLIKINKESLKNRGLALYDSPHEADTIAACNSVVAVREPKIKPNLQRTFDAYYYHTKHCTNSNRTTPNLQSRLNGAREAEVRGYFISDEDVKSHAVMGDVVVLKEGWWNSFYAMLCKDSGQISKVKKGVIDYLVTAASDKQKNKLKSGCDPQPPLPITGGMSRY